MCCDLMGPPIFMLPLRPQHQARSINAEERLTCYFKSKSELQFGWTPTGSGHDNTSSAAAIGVCCVCPPQCPTLRLRPMSPQMSTTRSSPN